MKRSGIFIVWVVAVCAWVGPALAAPQMDYRQRDALKDANYYLTQADGLVQAMEQASANWKAGDVAIPVREVKTVSNTRAKVDDNLKKANTRLEQLPAANADVAAASKQAKEIKEKLDAVMKKVDEIDKGVSGVVQQGKTAQYKTDFDRLREINLMFNDPQILRTRPWDAVEVVKMVAPMKQERQRIAKQYDTLLKQETGESEQLRGVLRHSDEVFGDFEKTLNKFVTDAPADIDSLIADTMKTAQMGVDDKKPAFFREGNGVDSGVKRTTQHLALLQAAAPDAPATKAATAKVNKLKADVDKMGKSLSSEILQANRLPAEGYSGPDADALRSLVKDKWAKEGNGDSVLALGLNGQSWTRKTQWVWNKSSSAFEKIDKSHAQGFVAVKPKTGGDVAVVHYVDLIKDHLAGDKIYTYFLDSPKDEPRLERQVLLKNIK